MNCNLLEEGFECQRLGDLAAALEIYRLVLAQDPSDKQALGLALQVCDTYQDFDLAIKLINAALDNNPHDYFALNNRGLVYSRINRIEDGILSFREAISIDSSLPEAHINLANSLNLQGRLEDSLIAYRRALDLDPKNPIIFFNQGNTLNQLGKKIEALESYDKAISLNSEESDYWVNRGSILSELQNYEEAGRSFDRAIELNHGNAEAWFNLAILLKKLKNSQGALMALEKTLSLNPDHANAWFNKGVLIAEKKEFPLALYAYEKALEKDPDTGYASGNLFYTKMLINDWSNLAQLKELLIRKIESNNQAIDPFSAIGIVDNLRLQAIAAKNWVLAECPPSKSAEHSRNIVGEKIRIGYYSADFHNHATTILMSELFELHDKNRFKIIAFSFGPPIDDDSRRRVQNAFDEFHDVSAFPDHDVASLSRRLGVDIALDLKGYTRDARPGIFSYRAAPIQINYLGFPGTMGAHFMDYIIADSTLVPEEHQNFYSEKIIYLPGSYQVNDSKRKASSRVFTRAELGLPDKGFIFCCFNNNYKITGDIFDSWTKILNNVQGSVLWLLEDNPYSRENILKEALARGLSHNRIIFGKRMEHSEHLARHQLADLSLDTLPYNAHTTSSDSLRVGVPVLTLAGKSFASRVGASLLNAVGLPELTTHSYEDYESLAIKLAIDSEMFLQIREKLRKNLETEPLFNTTLYTRNLESSFEKIYQRLCSNLPPEHIHI